MRSVLKLLGVAALAAAVQAAPAQAAVFVFPQTGVCTSNWNSARPYGHHHALDIAGPNRSPITAARAGRVAFYGWNGGYGLLMIVDHGNGYQTYYGHTSAQVRHVGDHVNAGDTIAYEGSTGHSTGPHVHFELRRYGTPYYMPGSVGATFHRGHDVGGSYPGLSAQSGGGSSGGGSGGGATAENKAFRVTASALNVRSGPGTGNASIGMVHSGEVYVSAATEGGWHKVWFNGRQGWSAGQYLASRSGVTARVVDVSALNVRTGPSTGHASVATIGSGQKYVEVSKSGAWSKIYFDGAAKWIHSTSYTHASSY